MATLTLSVPHYAANQLERTLLLLRDVKNDALEHSAPSQRAVHQAQLKAIGHLLGTIAGDRLDGDADLIEEVVEATLLDTIERLITVAHRGMSERSLRLVDDELLRAGALMALLRRARLGEEVALRGTSSPAPRAS